MNDCPRCGQPGLAAPLGKVTHGAHGVAAPIPTGKPTGKPPILPAILLATALALALGHSHDGWAAPQAEQPTLSIEERPTVPPQLFPPTYDEAVTALIRAFDVGAILAAGLDQAFARLPAKIGPIPKERYTQCARAKLSPEVVEAAVRPALAPEIQDAGLAMQLARLLGSPVGRKTREAALSGKEIGEAGITGADRLEFNRFMENPALKAFLEQGGLRRVKDAVTRAIRVESKSASDACVRELMPVYRLTNERSA